MNEVGYFTFSYFNTQEQKLNPAGVSGDSDGSVVNCNKDAQRPLCQSSHYVL